MTVREAEVERLARAHPDRQYVVHDGYWGGSYGTPQNPIAVTCRAAWHLLARAAARGVDVDPLAAVAQAYPPLQYAEEGDPLYEQTDRHRSVQLLAPTEWVLTDGHGVGEPRGFGLDEGAPR